MDDQPRKRFNFAKLVVVLAIVFVISLGMCGMSAAVSSASRGQETIYIVVMFTGLGGMILSGLALFFTLIVWLIASLAGGSKRNEPASLPIVDDKEQHDPSS
jgi:hypothetical protein